MEKQNNSNRTYAVRKCKNPNCDFGGEFAPTWFTQVFCCVQCRINYYNDLRREKAAGSHSDEKLLRMTDDILREIKKKTLRRNSAITDALLEYENVDINLGVRQVTNKESNRDIRWFYRFGLEYIPETKRYIIHERKIKK